MCHNIVGSFECKCKAQYRYGDGFACFEDLNLVIIPQSEPYLHSKDFTFAHKITLRIRLIQTTFKATILYGLELGLGETAF